MNAKVIEIGDTVSVSFSHSTSTVHGTVEHIPCGPGDSWTINENGVIYYVQSYEVMRLVRKGDEA